MKTNLRDLRIKCQHMLLMASGMLPLIWLLLCHLAPDLLLRGTLLTALTAAAMCACLLIPGKRRLAAGLTVAALLLAAGAILLPPAQTPLLLTVPGLCIALLMISLPIAGWSRERELHVGWHFAAVGTHLLMQVLLFGADKMGNPAYEGMQGPLTVSFLLSGALVTLALNRSSLDCAAQSRRTVPLLMRRQNTVITLALLAAGVGVAAIPAIGQALDVAWGWIRQGIRLLAALLSSLMPRMAGSSGGSAAPADASFGLGEAAEPSPFALLMEKVLGVAALAILAIALLLAARVLGKKLWRLIRRLWKNLGRYGAAASEDYVDEITDTRDEPDTERESLLNRLRRFAPEDDSALDPTQRVRSRYRRLKRRHSDWSRASTARETLPDSAAALYEQARYSGQPVTEEEAERFRRDTKRL